MSGDRSTPGAAGSSRFPVGPWIQAVTGANLPSVAAPTGPGGPFQTGFAGPPLTAPPGETADWLASLDHAGFLQAIAAAPRLLVSLANVEAGVLYNRMELAPELIATKLGEGPEAEARAYFIYRHSKPGENSGTPQKKVATLAEMNEASFVAVVKARPSLLPDLARELPGILYMSMDRIPDPWPGEYQEARDYVAFRHKEFEVAASMRRQLEGGMPVAGVMEAVNPRYRARVPQWFPEEWAAWQALISTRPTLGNDQSLDKDHVAAYLGDLRVAMHVWSPAISKVTGFLTPLDEDPASQAEIDAALTAEVDGVLPRFLFVPVSDRLPGGDRQWSLLFVNRSDPARPRALHYDSSPEGREANEAASAAMRSLGIEYIQRGRHTEQRRPADSGVLMLQAIKMLSGLLIRNNGSIAVPSVDRLKLDRPSIQTHFPKRSAA